MADSNKPRWVENRWVQLCAGILAMVMVANYQYAFTLFTPGMKEQFAGTPYSQIALVFSLFLVFETWPVPIVGVLMDRFGIRKLVVVGSLLVFAGWAVSGLWASRVSQLYLSYSLFTGVGAGIIYLAATANAIRWFPDRRGLASGLTTAGYGGGSALSLIPISMTIHSVGWGTAMAIWGTLQAVVIFLLAFVLRHPPEGWRPAGWVPKVTSRLAQTTRSYTWRQTLFMPEFYLLYFIHFFVSLGGLMTLGNLSEIARSLHVQNALIFGISIVAFAATANGIAIIASRVLWGSVSDRFGRENTMGLVFTLEAIFIFLVTRITGHPVLFVLVFPLVFLGYGQVNSLLSSATGDLFGTRNVAANFGLTYTAKGLAGLFGGWGAAVLAALFAGSFQVPYYVGAGCDLLAAVLALVILKPLARARMLDARNKAVDELPRTQPGLGN
jgi:OFA family oxalate/formate antiporter-like MFS transporter